MAAALGADDVFVAVGKFSTNTSYFRLYVMMIYMSFNFSLFLFIDLCSFIFFIFFKLGT